MVERSIGFWSVSRRQAALAVYLMGGLKANASLLKELGPHKIGGGCLYLRRLEEIDTNVLARLIKRSHDKNRGVTKQVSTGAKRRKRAG